jgi:hypothetical protein
VQLATCQRGCLNGEESLNDYVVTSIGLKTHLHPLQVLSSIIVLWTFKTVQEAFCFPAEDSRGAERQGSAQLGLPLLDRTGLDAGQPEEHEPEVKAHALGAREAPCEGAELRERDARPGLVETNDGGSDTRFGVLRLETDGRVVLPLG